MTPKETPPAQPGMRTASDRDPDVRPTWDERGLPLCDDACPNFDGKRCKAMGFRPDRFCEPMLIQLNEEHAAHAALHTAALARARAEALEEAATEIEIQRVKEGVGLDAAYLARCVRALDNRRPERP